MLAKVLAAGGLGGVGAVIGGSLGGLAGLVISAVYSYLNIVPYFTAQVQNAPEWTWVAVVIALVPSGIVVIVGLVIGLLLGAAGLGLPALLAGALLVRDRGGRPG